MLAMKNVDKTSEQGRYPFTSAFFPLVPLTVGGDSSLQDN